MPKTLTDVLSEPMLLSRAGSTSYERGKKIHAQRAISNLRVTLDAAHADVAGSARYRVVLQVNQGRLDGSCSCPYSDGEKFCKHCVAVGLACLEKPGKSARDDAWNRIENYVRQLGQADLAELVLRAARDDERMVRSLLRQAGPAQDPGGKTDLKRHFLRLIEDASAAGEFIDWHDAPELAETLDELLASLAELLEPVSAGVLAELLEYAIGRVEALLEQVDDSAGSIGAIVYQMGHLHRQACEMAGADPVALAERLFHAQLALPLGLHSFAPIPYSDLLEEAGVRHYRALTQARMAAIEAAPAADVDEYERGRLVNIAENLARAEGDVEALVALWSDDLSSSRLEEIVRLYRESGQEEQALAWAERGVAAFPHHPSAYISAYLVSRYLAGGRHAQAVELAWQRFELFPCLDRYQALARVAEAAGQWPAQRERALALIGASDSKVSAWRAGMLSLRLSIALWEEDLDTAWKVAMQGRCEQRLLLSLADKLAPTRLDDAAILYRDLITRLVEQTSNQAYEEAIGLVLRLGNACQVHRRNAEMNDYLDSLRIEFKRKRNFIKLLDGLSRT